MVEDNRTSTVSHALRAGAASVAVTVADPGGLLGVEGVRTLERQVKMAAHVLGTGGEVRVRVVGDGEMAAAHAEFLDDPTTTDVLTFNMAEGEREGEPLDVDMLTCVDEARRQAAARGHPVERELLLYVIHGVLHCLGHDDHDEAAAARMHAEEDRVLEAIGVGATYARPEGAGGCPAEGKAGR